MTEFMLSPVGFALGIAGALFVGTYAVISAWTREPREKKRPNLCQALRAHKAREQKNAARRGSNTQSGKR